MSLAIRAWFRMARQFAALWIPAFAGMTGVEGGNDGAAIVRISLLSFPA